MNDAHLDCCTDYGYDAVGNFDQRARTNAESSRKFIMSTVREENVYLCSWRTINKRVEIQVLKHNWVVLGDSFEDAESQLIDLISNATGDLQPCFEYDPEPPKDAVQARFDGGILAVSGANNPLDFLGNPEKLFADGICKVCKFGKGERLEVPLIISRLPTDSDAGYVRVRLNGPYGNMNLQIYSERFVENLVAKERQRFRWIAVETEQKSKQPFFEPVSASVIPMILPKGLFKEEKRLQPDGFHCGACGRKQLAGIPQGSGGIYSFISEDAIPKPNPSCFQIGQFANLYFCMTRERWQELRGKPGTKRLMSRQIGVVKKSWVNSDPKLNFLH